MDNINGNGKQDSVGCNNCVTSSAAITIANVPPCISSSTSVSTAVSSPSKRPSGIAAILAGRPSTIENPAPGIIPASHFAHAQTGAFVPPMHQSISHSSAVEGPKLAGLLTNTKTEDRPSTTVHMHLPTNSVAPQMSNVISQNYVAAQQQAQQPFPAVPAGPYGILAHTGQAIVFNPYGQPVGIVQPVAGTLPTGYYGNRPASPAARSRANGPSRQALAHHPAGYPLAMPVPPSLSRYAPLLPSTLHPNNTSKENPVPRQPQPILPMPTSGLFPSAVLPHPYGVLPNGTVVYKTAQGGLVAFQVQEQQQPVERSTQNDNEEKPSANEQAPMVQALPPSTVASTVAANKGTATAVVTETTPITKEDTVMEDAPPPLILGADPGPTDVDIRSLFMQEVEKNAPPKPGILTHVLDGFIIHESLEPFVVNPFPFEDYIPAEAFQDRSTPESEMAASRPPPELEAEQQSNTPIKCKGCNDVLSSSPYIDRRGEVTQCCKKKCYKEYRKNLRQQPESQDMEPSSSEKKDEGLLSIVTPPIRIRRSQIQPPVETMNIDGGTPSTNTSVSVQDETECTSPKVPATHKHPTDWTVDEVYGWVWSRGGSVASTAATFKNQEIDGQALVLLSEDHLIKTLGIKVGPAVKLCSFLTDLKREWAIPM